MKKFRVIIYQEVHEQLVTEIEANDVEEAKKLAEQKRIDAENSEWDGAITDIDFSIEEVEEENQ